MALSSPPPAEGSSSSMTTSATLTRPLYPKPPPPPPPQPHPQQPQQPQQQQPQQQLPPNYSNLLYPPRGYYPPNPNPNPIPNLNIYTSRPTLWFPNPQLPQGLGFMAPPNHLHQIILANSSPAPPATALKPLPLSKMAFNHPPLIQNNGVKDPKDRSRDGSFMVVRDRKVKISEDSSLYALCRSWLRNGLPEETEPQYIDIIKSLPRPLPLARQDSQSPGKKEEQEVNDEEEGGGFVEHLSPQDLLQKHIKRAKRVRSRLREERLRRIARYKTRLSLLLPPIVEQHYRNESTAGNGNTS